MISRSRRRMMRSAGSEGVILGLSPPLSASPPAATLAAFALPSHRSRGAVRSPLARAAEPAGHAARPALASAP